MQYLGVYEAENARSVCYFMGMIDVFWLLLLEVAMGRRRKNAADGAENGVKQRVPKDGVSNEAVSEPVNGERKARRRRMPKDGDDGKAVRKKADGEAGKQRKVTIDDVFADDELEEKKKDRGMIFLSVFLAFLIMGLIAFLIFMLRSDLERVVLGMPEFEESVVRDGEPAEDGERVDLAVVPDFVVTKEDSSFPIPYPEGNVFDVEFAFVNEKGKEVYHTKRIKPGTIVSIPAYEFCKMGKETYEIRVEVYDGDTFKPVQSAVALEMKITKE